MKRTQMVSSQIYWTEATRPAYRRGSDENNLAIILQNPQFSNGSFADCDTGRFIESVLHILSNQK